MITIQPRTDIVDFQEDPRMKDNFERAGMDVKQFWCEQIPAYPKLGSENNECIGTIHNEVSL